MAPSLDYTASTDDVTDSTFTRPRINLLQRPDGQEDVRSLPDLIQFNAIRNPHHLFTLQEVKREGKHVGFDRISFLDLYNAVQDCKIWLRRHAFAGNDENLAQQKPIALFMESDVGLFIYLSALLWLEIPVLLLSARLGPAAIRQLLTKTDASRILVSKRTKETALRALDDSRVNPVLAPSYSSFIGSHTIGQDSQITFASVPTRNDKPGAIILHSSGTTGLPKPIYLTHRYTLGYAACHRLTHAEAFGRVNLSTLPLYHGFGLLAPCLGLSVGKPVCFPASSIIPSASSTLDLLLLSGARSLMSVPSVVEEIVSFSDEQTFPTLSKLDFVAVGGGAIKMAVGEALHSHDVKLLNHYGATELGAIAPVFIPNLDYDWHYLRLRSDMGLQLQKLDSEDGTEFFKLVGYPFGWDQPFEVQDKLVKNPAAPGTEMEVKILGRKDDVVVLATGEKVLPQTFEEVLNAKESIKAAVVYGAHRESVGVLIEPSEPLDASQQEEFFKTVWPWIDEVNKSVDRHARIPSPSAIILVPAGKTIPRSDKGSVMRNEVERVFEQEISTAYETLEKASDGPQIDVDARNPLPGLRSLVWSILGERMSTENISDNVDFFELGMDSLEATRLARKLNILPNKSAFPGLKEFNGRADFIYRHPRISALSKALIGNATIVNGTPDSNGDSRATQMHDTLNMYLGRIRNHMRSDAVVLLTGSTGNLGANILANLCRDPNVKTVICLNRPHRRGLDPVSQQQAACQSKGVELPPESQEKVVYFQTLTHERYLGLKSAEEYDLLVSNVTHIIHNAWPMDFKRQLPSFASQIEATENLVTLALDIHQARPQVVPKIVFTSSIAVIGRYPAQHVPEDQVTDPQWTVPMGYAEAKWVCEGLLVDAAKSYPGWFKPAVVRVGQLSGSTENGYWSTAEHFPVLTSAAKAVGAFPEISGTYSWLPVDIAARVMSDITFDTENQSSYYHLENPIRQPWKDLLQALSAELGLPSDNSISFDEWLELAKAKTDTVAPLEEFFRAEFQTLASGQIILQTDCSRATSRVLRSCGGVEFGLVKKYLEGWKAQGVL